jgi:hypothetical protein
MLWYLRARIVNPLKAAHNRNLLHDDRATALLAELRATPGVTGYFARHSRRDSIGCAT